MDRPAEGLEAGREPLPGPLVADHDRAPAQPPRLRGQVPGGHRLGELVDQQVVRVVPERHPLVEDGEPEPGGLGAGATHVAGGDERERTAQVLAHEATS